MSDKTARIHSHASSRAKIREPGERRAVFKSVLDSPFRIHWPSIPMNLQNSLLPIVIAMMDGVAEYRMEYRKGNRKRKRVDKHGLIITKKRKTDTNETMSDESLLDVDGHSTDVEISLPVNNSTLKQPTKLQHIVVGINEVTKRLESQIRASRTIIVRPTMKNPEVDLSQSPLKVVLVCRADIDTPMLIDHLPHLVAAYNSAQAKETLKLAMLPKGAEVLLAQAMGLRRAAVVGIHANLPELETLMPLLSSIPTLSATWLTLGPPRQEFIPTHIKQIRTSAPKNMKAEKQRRKEGKALAKKAKKTSATSVKSSS